MENRAKDQSIEEVLESATKLAHAARSLWDEARYRIGEEHRYKYAAERGLLAPLPPSDPPPVQEMPPPSPNSRSLGRSTRARSQRQQRVQEPAEQAQEATGEAQAGGEEEEATQEADRPHVPAGQVSQKGR
ncbi:hypothetical protein KEM55_002110 [Ascosphaera atra]|nr:hypothetical protein KEM55_002110 [Ascosphaera atra]